MKYLLILTVGICLLISVPAMADQAEDEAAIRKVEEMYIAAYNAHDSEAVHATYVEDVQVWRGHISGRAAATKNLAEVFAGPYKNLKVKVENEIGIVFITPDVAIYKAVLAGSGMVDEEGKALPPAKNMYAKVYVKKNGKWLGAHGYFSRPIEQ
jgi:uncharacterized protein (TIGR02246 family)